MTSSKIFALVFMTTVTTILLVVIIHLLNRRFKSITDEANLESNGHGIWYAGTIASAGLIFWQTITIVNEAMDSAYLRALVVQDPKLDSPFWASMKSSFLLVGLGTLWFVLWYYAAMGCTKLILGDKDDREEMLAHNSSYFIVRAGLHIALSLAFLPFLSAILRTFLPATSVAFYH